MLEVAFWDGVGLTTALDALAFNGAFLRVSAAALAKALGKSGLEVLLASEEDAGLDAFDIGFAA